MDSEIEGLSETGLLVFVGTLGGLAVVIVVAALLALGFAHRHRMLTGCGVFLGGAAIGTPVLIVATIIARSI
ncbi:hypothetical protein [Brachybacterium massiliense]|uniref:hypothetical protein n=1 Tax=Brachybacterium massiliense TaxID=1755098 RepID=UPI000B3BACCA|nr:hypothetical protein [Brachybacterium massiliense]